MRKDTAAAAKPIHGDSLYQVRAQQALPILVRQAKANAPISYGDLAQELGMPNPRNLNYVLGSIGETLKALTTKWSEEVPFIQCLVLNKNTGLPGHGIGWFFSDIDTFKKLPKRQQQALIRAELYKIFAYNKWDRVLHELSLKPAPFDYEAYAMRAASYRGGGESEHHKKLKQYVASRPAMFGLPNSSIAEIERLLPSGDSLDVLFTHDDGELFAVEVKSRVSSTDDIVRGMFQCIKYTAVLHALQSLKSKPQNAKAVLVLESPLPQELLPVRNMLGVEIIDKVSP